MDRRGLLLHQVKLILLLRFFEQDKVEPKLPVEQEVYLIITTREMKGASVWEVKQVWAPVAVVVEVDTTEGAVLPGQALEEGQATPMD
mmetsp:Transcript_26093/g.35960  ORF Transcript_26093/g.35960 Transcript_26093/m.35960 type:complete len:88 (+) Transcript_26093:335-598(+)